jgi:hypothetical protein
MVTVSDFELREAPGGKKRVFLKVISDDLVPQRSRVSGKIYLKPLSTTLFAAIEKEQAEILVGSKLKGNIEKVSVDPYEVVDPISGEIQFYNYRYEYVPETDQTN